LRTPIAILGLAFVIAGCGSTIQSAPQAGSPAFIAASPLGNSSPSPASTPDPAAVKAAAATAYLAIATRYNASSDAINKTCGAVTTTFKAARACASRAATAEYAFYTAANRLQVPGPMLSDQRALIRAASAEYVLVKSQAVAKTVADFNALSAPLDRATKASESAANTFRLDLGLPPVPIK
jgi:hypothetical protein